MAETVPGVLYFAVMLDLWLQGTGGLWMVENGVWGLRGTGDLDLGAVGDFSVVKAGCVGLVEAGEEVGALQITGVEV